jgi:ubiquitin carboxyl-terminal hydrolase 22/27/51
MLTVGQALAGYQQQDAHEYMQFILNTLHLANGGSADSDDCKCVVHQTFYGKLSSTVTCDSCRNVTTAQDPYMDLSLDIKNQSKKRKHNTDKGDEVTLDLRDCLERFTAKEKLGSAEYTCRNCDSPQNATKQLSIKRLPPVLAVHLKVRTTLAIAKCVLKGFSASSIRNPHPPKSKPASAFPPSWISTRTPLRTSSY